MRRIPSDFGCRVRLARVGAGMSVGRLAEMTGLSTRSLQNYESGLHVPNLRKLRLISGATGQTEDFFLNLEIE